MIKELSDAAAITTITQGHRNRAAEYRLNLDPLRQRNGGAIANETLGHLQRTGGATPQRNGGAKEEEDNQVQHKGVFRVRLGLSTSTRVLARPTTSPSRTTEQASA